MYSFIKGKILFVNETSVEVENNGMGYFVNTPFYQDEQIGNTIEIYLYTHIRESELSLWGFKNKKELEFFKLLIMVSGVGPKTAQNLLFILSLESILQYIRSNVPEKLKVSGVGLKTAQKIILELSSKINGFSLNGEVFSKENMEKELEAKEALVSLGFEKRIVEALLSEILKEDSSKNWDTPSLVKLALSKFRKNNGS